MANTDVKMFYVEDDIEKIQTKTNLYLQSYGSEGAFHLAREVIQNSIDECVDKDSPGKNILIKYNKLTDELTVEDDGRGFPEIDYPMDIFCTKIQSGSKFFRTQSGGTSGEFGLGLTAVNALSTSFFLESCREKEKYKHTIAFENGKKISDKKVDLKKGDKKHGCVVRFIPSRTYLGAKTVMPYESMLKWIETQSYFIPEGIKIEVEIYNGLKLKEHYTYKAQPFIGLLNNITADSSDRSSVCELSGDSSIDEKVKILDKNDKVTEKVMKKNIHLDVAFAYIPDTVTLYDSYCNYTNTTEGGVHLDTVETCVCRYLTAKAKATQTDNQKDKYKILWEDVKAGLCMVVNLTTGAQVGFVGNAKQKVGNTELVPFIAEITNKALNEFFDNNPKILEEYIKAIKLNCKARIEMGKIKQASQRERMDSFKEHNLNKYIRCNNTGKSYKELWLTEGDSAGGSCSNACDKDTQAFLLFRGNVMNPINCSLSEVMENEEWKTFVTVLRCGIGPSFDMKKLYFDRINIFTDSDADGYYISSGMIAFIYTYLRPLIEAGKVYKVFAPLYRIDDKEHPFVINKQEMVEIFQKKVINHYKITLESGQKLDKERMIEFLQDTYEYSSTLIRLANSLGRINKFLIERILAVLTVSGYIGNGKDFNIEKTFSNQNFIKKFMCKIQEKFPEITLDAEHHILRGVVNGKFCSIKINRRFINNSEDLIKIYKKYHYQLLVKEKDKEPIYLSIGEFLDQAEKLQVKIITRYKGLGELNWQDMHKTALDINNRVSIQFTTEDAERETRIFNMLYGNKQKNLKDRADLMRDYKISRIDLDN